MNFILALLLSMISSSALSFSWTSAYSTHATGPYRNFAERNAQGKAVREMGDFVSMCETREGSLTYSFERNYCLLESPGFPAECVITTTVRCATELTATPADDSEPLAGLYYSETDQHFIEIFDDLSFKTSLHASFRKGQRIVFSEGLRRISNDRYHARGTIRADGRCTTSVSIEIEKLDDGSVIVEETGPHNLNWNFGCAWQDIYPTYYNLNPVVLEN